MLRPALFVQNCDRVLFPDDFYARQFFSGLKFLRRALFPPARVCLCRPLHLCGCRICPRVVMCRSLHLCGCRICYRVCPAQQFVCAKFTAVYPCAADRASGIGCCRTTRSRRVGGAGKSTTAAARAAPPPPLRWPIPYTPANPFRATLQSDRSPMPPPTPAPYRKRPLPPPISIRPPSRWPPPQRCRGSRGG